MKSPLNKRLIRDFRDNFGKYIVIFVIMFFTIAIVSGFLVSVRCLKTAFDNSFEKFNIEDGHFVVEEKLNDEAKLAIEKYIDLYELNYKQEMVGDLTYRIYKNRESVNLVDAIKGRLPKNEGEIAIDRIFATKNDYSIGDAITIAGREYEIVGYASLSDNYTFFKNTSDIVFNAQKNTAAVVTKEEFDKITDAHLNICYAFKFKDKNLTDEEKAKKGGEITKLLVENGIMPKEFILEEDNSSIHFAGDDLGGDRSMMIVLLYIMIVIMAFVFAVTAISTIEQESMVIGTLRASGYKRSELTLYYMLLPIIVSLLAAIVGNVLGYTYFRDVMANLYLNSYALPKYEIEFNSEAFILTTVIPMVILIVIEFTVIYTKLRLSPVRFLRNDIKLSRKQSAKKLPNWKFFTRFRMRILGQNAWNYVVMFFGVFFASLIMFFSLMMPDIMTNYKDDALSSMFCDNTYILKMPLTTKTKGAEKMACSSLDFKNGDIEESIMIYGISKDSKYLDLDFECDGVYISEGYLKKFDEKIGDVIKLKKKYGDEEYSFKIGGTIHYPTGFAIFMPIEDFNEKFDMSSNYYNGYFSDNEITDISEKYIAKKITASDMTAISDQLFDSMGGMMKYVTVFAFAIYVMLIYLVSKLIIEKNSKSISLVKILGYQNYEVGKLYIISTGIVVLISLGICIFLSDVVMHYISSFIFATYSGWIDIVVGRMLYVKLFVLGVVGFSLIVFLQLRNIKRIPMQEALKNNEE